MFSQMLYVRPGGHGTKEAGNIILASSSRSSNGCKIACIDLNPGVGVKCL